MDRIKIAIAGIGNCTSSLIQGIEHYRSKENTEHIGLMHYDLGGYLPHDIEVVAAFDIDKRKVGKDISEAIFQLPNCTKEICTDVPKKGVVVKMGRILDSFADHMKNYDMKYTFLLSDEEEPSEEEIVRILKESGADMLLNYLPVGSEDAVKFYADCALNAGIGFINNIPVFIASDPTWAARFEEKNLPLIGDDIKSQLGATIVHRVLTNLFRNRGVKLERTYQSQLGADRLDDENIHIGPSDWVAWQKDNKICFVRMEGKLFGDVPMNLEMRLSVEDSPNSAGVGIDAIRCVKLALNRGQGGVLQAPSAYFCKHPAHQFTDDEAFRMLEEFINKG
ncbi:MAG: inositol-3-phosphate synthase [Deltaproteobacteria bacterium]|nr:inositol-3-phosphate synthase [Deltaproteobacteria bacterium]